MPKSQVNRVDNGVKVWSNDGMLNVWLPQREGGNLGDDFQSVSLCRFFADGDHDYTLRWYERDSLRFEGEYNPKDTNVILFSGWYSHNPAWPVMPPDDAIPIFVGYHDCASEASPDKLQRLRALAERSPIDIGCRDTLTCGVFVKAGIPAKRIYPSWCATLTLQPFTSKPTRDICLVIDAPDGEWLQRIATCKWSALSQVLPDLLIPDRHARYNLAVERLLSLYHARCVVTSRLHVGIPCAVYGTPVILAAQGRCADPRYADYAAMFHYDCYAGTGAMQPTLEELQAMQIGRARHVKRMRDDATDSFQYVMDYLDELP